MPEAVNPAQDLVDEEFPDIYRPLIPAALRRAYNAADSAYEKLDFLGTPSGKFHRGDLIVLATEHEFVRLIDTGHLPFDYSWEEYASPTGKHLVIRSPRSLITLNQVRYPIQKPRSARFRNDIDIPNMQYLFPEWNEPRADDLRKHILLLHGYQELGFSNLSVPHPTRNRLIWRTDNLLKLPHEVSDAAFAGEGPTESPEAEYIEKIVQIVHDEGDNE